MDITHARRDDTAPPCSPQRLCRKTRTCPRCAKIKQAQAGDLAEKLERFFGPLFLSVLTPESQTPEAIAALRRRWVRLSHVPAALWSVEEGDKRGTLHLNVLHPVCKPAHPSAATIHTAPLATAPRIAAAYITKLRQAPGYDRHPGRIFGRCGHLLHFLALDDEAPMLQAAAINQLLSEPTTPEPGRYAWNIPERTPDLDPAEYKAIAARHLPNLAALAALLRSKAPPAL